MYHLRPPTRVRNVELIKHWEPKKVTDSPLRHHHLKTADIPRRGDLYTSRIPMLFNQDMIAYRARPAKTYDKFEYYKNGGADEIIFVFKGGGTLETVFGKLPYRAEDYIVIPRGITYRLVPDKVEEEDYLILESVGPVRIPQRYLNHEGQIKMGAPYSERDFHAPTEIITIDKEEDVDVLVKDGGRFTRVTLAHHPFDAVGWDGYLYPFTFNAQDFEPITGTVHQPPPIHQTFEIRGYVVCTFAPRFLDTHPEAVKIPWVHDNVEADEVLFYVRGNFGSRRGIERLDYVASARNSSRPASRNNHGEQRCAAHGRARGHVRYATHARTHGRIAQTGRSEISVELAGLITPLYKIDDKFEAVELESSA